ncbi:MAG: O-antigen ligase family protein [Candidatus Methanomethylicaceae archaeon]
MDSYEVRKDRRNIRFALKASFLAGTLLFLAWMGRSLARGSSLPVLIAIALISLLIIAPDPVRGLCVAYPVMFLIPYGILWFNFPLFNSPLDIVVMLTAGLGILRFVRHKRSLPKSGGIFPLLLVCIFILVGYALVGHGEVAGLRLFRFVQGLWPFVLVLLLIETPKQAMKVLSVLLATFVLLSITWLPGLITAGKIGGNIIRSANEAQELGKGVTKISLAYVSGNLSYLTLLAIAFVAVMALGWVIASKKARFLTLVGTLLLCAVVIWSSYASALVALISGVFILLLILMFSRTIKTFSVVSWLLFIVAAIALIVLILPQGMTTMERIVKPSEDPSARSRMWAFSQGAQAFRANPLTGYGAYDRPKAVGGGYVLAGHNTFIALAYEFGLLFMLPYAMLFLMIARGFCQLIKRIKDKEDKVLAMSLAAVFGAAIITGFLTNVFLEPAQDAIIWLFVGLMTVWNGWLDRDHEARLVE